uniref:Uncharacterized protein n=1 Tax=Anopheles arabiensis TaxID=7173 RepID=A0A182I5E3_ANOAR
MEDGHQDTVQHDEGDSVQDGDANFTDDSDVEAGSALNIDNMSIEDGIRYWALSNNQTHQSINMVLRLFKKTGVKVPASAKTLLKTKRNPSSEIKDIDGGQFWYRGFRSCLLNYFRSVKVPPNCITLTLSIDGLPLHNSSNMQFWPILFKIEELPQAPVMAAAIFFGFQKPNNIEEFLRPAVDELNLLMANGIIIHGKKTKWKVAGQLLDKFVKDFETLYGERYISSNVHNLRHVLEEVEHFESFWSISTYVFENYLQFLKRLLRSGWKNLEQAINRLCEMDEMNMQHASTQSNSNYPTVKQRGNVSTLNINSNFLLHNNTRNFWFLTKNDHIVKFQSATK